MSDQVRILIVEDEFITMDALRDALMGMGYGISGDAMKADEALKILDEGQTDLAILDIHIKGARSGIWLAEQIRERYHIPFIFLTAFGDKQTIADASRTQPGSYLVKPFVEQDLHAAIELAINTHSALTAPAPHVPAVQNTQQQPQLLINDSIFVKDDLVYRRISVADIQYIQSFRNYLELNVGKGKKYVLRSTLKDFLAQLPPNVFIVTHRSYAVNLRRVNRIGGNFVGIDDHEVPLSREVRQEVVRRLNTYQ
ncbi:LytR/AlgR family response regulator transcription factor [Neolewinella persica]|uniref:LytR/AlgR family response regulator transcription factor n=1 Tax=Neolewinella persica TaxID=70998 RepID=UPI00037DB80C|nr:response regulator [Neolewinella persica]